MATANIDRPSFLLLLHTLPIRSGGDQAVCLLTAKIRTQPGRLLTQVEEKEVLSGSPPQGPIHQTTRVARVNLSGGPAAAPPDDLCGRHPVMYGQGGRGRLLCSALN